MKLKNTPKKPPKDIDSAERSYFLLIVMWILRWGLIALPVFIFKFGWFGIIVWLLVCLTLSVLIELFTDSVGSFAGKLYRGGNPPWSVAEQLQGDLDFVRVQKTRGNTRDALVKLEEILTKSPSCAEALYIKADILYHEFGERGQALYCLDAIFRSTGADDPFHQWAVTLRDKIRS